MDYFQLFTARRPYDTVGTLSDALGRTSRDMAQSLQTWDPDELLNTPIDDLVGHLVGKASVHCPSLRDGDAFLLEPVEVDHEFIDFGERRTRRVTRLVLVVPFEGERSVFTLRANQWSTMPPQVLRLKDHEVHLAIDNPPTDPTAVRENFDQQIANIEKHLSWSRQQIDLHNQQVRDDVPAMVANRREELLATRNLQAGIGYPVRRRPDADTYSVPMSRRTVRATPRRPPGARMPFKPEPIMQEADYQAALQVLRAQRNALERTPSVAAKLNEEEIRDILLIGLNSQFEGAVGGELFNGEGKTDILVRVDDRNIFIGECKVWSGPKTMDDALDQLFRYLVWRDTKAAILLFIRNKDVSSVIDKAIARIETHPNWKRSNVRQSDDHYGFTMHASDDGDREIHLTLIPFALRQPTS